MIYTWHNCFVETGCSKSFPVDLIRCQSEGRVLPTLLWNKCRRALLEVLESQRDASLLKVEFCIRLCGWHFTKSSKFYAVQIYHHATCEAFLEAITSSDEYTFDVSGQVTNTHNCRISEVRICTQLENMSAPR